MDRPSTDRARPADFYSIGSDEQHLHVRVWAEFVEMPGLTLTVAQAARLFSIETPICERVLGTLVRRGVLRTDGRAFARIDDRF